MLGKKIEVTTYDFKGVTLRAAVIDGKLWFPTRDVALVIGHNPNGIMSNMREILGDDECFTLTRASSNELHGLFAGRIARIAVVSESGLFKFLLRAQRTRPVAREFQDWVTKVVLPGIRERGGYVMDVEKVATGEIAAEVAGRGWHPQRPHRRPVRGLSGALAGQP